MNNFSKISIAVICVSFFIISSCTKDEQIIKGCTDSAAMNYQSLATDNDGSCIYAYDIAQGVWNIETACEDLSITILTQTIDIPLNDIFPDTIEIKGEGASVVSLDVNGSLILADIENNGNVTMHDGQKISFDTGMIGEVDVLITGSGVIVSESEGNFTLNLAFEIPFSGTETSTCEIAFSK